MKETFYKQIYPAQLCHFPVVELALLPRGDTTPQLLRFIQHVTEKFNDTAAIFLGVPKHAARPGEHASYTYKLDTAGLPDSNLLLLASYLTDHKYRVKMEG
jgi:hypothetical protein